MLRSILAALLTFAAAARPADAEVRAGESLREAREHMVETQIAARGVSDPKVLAAMRAVPRERFVPAAQRRFAYDDRPLPIGHGQTISQPFVVALMTQLAGVEAGDRVLEVGTGSGYQAAVLAQMGVEVYSIEIIEPLAERAEATLAATGYADRVTVRSADGYAGWPEHAPFDAVVVTAAPPSIPEPLKQQLKVGGHLVIPVGRSLQSLRRITRTATGFEDDEVIPVRFVPMTGRAQHD